MTFPISLALIGAPGSGKQKLIEAFQEVAADYLAENDQELHVIPNAGTVIEETYDQAMGAFGGYVEDQWANYIRHEAEIAAKAKGVSYITSGTVIENIAHCGVNMEAILGGITTPQTELRIQQNQVAMAALSMYFAERFRYTFGFYLPYKQKVIIAGQDEFEAHYQQRVDHGIQTVMQNFGLRIQVLDEPSYEEKAAAILATVQEIIENGARVPTDDSQSEVSDAPSGDDYGPVTPQEVTVGE